MQGGDMIKGESQYQSLYLNKQGENTKVGGENIFGENVSVL